ncbi:MAG: hypothetical protein ACE5JA_07465 [bacterium]
MGRKSRAKERRRKNAKRPVQKKARLQMVRLGPKNYALGCLGLFFIVFGFITLARGSITLAPILLVLGYCVVVPAAILIK